MTLLRWLDRKIKQVAIHFWGEERVKAFQKRNAERLSKILR